MSIAIGPVTNLFTKQMYKFIESRKSWDTLRWLTTDVKVELLFWSYNLSKQNGLSMKTKPDIKKIVYSDASSFAYGGYVIKKLGKIIAKENFTKTEMSKSSTYRELLAVKNVLTSLLHVLKNETVQWFSDNSNVSRIINSGSTKSH